MNKYKYLNYGIKYKISIKITNKQKFNHIDEDIDDHSI